MNTKSYTVYILENHRGKLYIGQTGDVRERLKRHNGNQVHSTKNRGPWKIIYTKRVDGKSEAVRFEKYLKRLKNKSYILSKYCRGVV